MGMEELKAKKSKEPEVEAAPEMSNTEKRALLAKLQADLDLEEKKSGRSGAVPLTTKRKLLDASEVAAKHPDKHVRWVQTAVDAKATMRQEDGYERIPASEGGKQVGNLALFAIPKEKYEQKIEEIKKVGKERLASHNREVEAVAEAVMKELRDRHGLDVPREKIIIRE